MHRYDDAVEYSRAGFQELVGFLLERLDEEEAMTDHRESNGSIPLDCWGPTRVQSECDMKRELIRFHTRLLAKERSLSAASTPPSNREKATAMYQIALMAQPYAYHDDFNPLWYL